jgi:hypothetical protein
MLLLRCLFLGSYGKPSFLRAIRNSSLRLFVLPVAPGSAARHRSARATSSMIAGSPITSATPSPPSPDPTCTTPGLIVLISGGSNG